MRPGGAARSTFAALAGLALAGCNRVQTTLEPAADQARAIDGIWRLMLWVCGGMYLLVLLGLAWALWRARRRLAADPTPITAASPDEGRMGRTLAAWSALIVAGLFVLTTASFLVDRSLARASADPTLKIKVTANQWWWSIEYQDEADPSRGFITANELHLPVGRRTQVELASNDVIHSFWVPNLHGKLDLIPGRSNRLVITPRREGLYRGQCAEFCGLQHARMALQVVVQSPAAFAAWRATQVRPALQPAEGAAAAGAQAFAASGCVLCHAIRGTDAGGTTGPDLTHVASRRTIAAGTLANNAGTLAAWIEDPQRFKPGVNMPSVPLTAEQRTAVAAYLGSLR
jgi:cytochrome c oxidase subunit 2